MAQGDRPDLFHKFKVWTYPSYLKPTVGKFIARTDTEKVIAARDVASEVKNRSRHEAEPDIVETHARYFMDEAIYELLDGYAVNFFDYFTIVPHISGTFSHPNDKFDPEKNKIRYSLRILKEFKEMMRHIEVENMGEADVNGYIIEYYDRRENVTNTLFSQGGLFSLSGYKIRIAGDHPSCGLWFVDAENPDMRVKITNILDNDPVRITGNSSVVPPTSSGHFHIEVVTQYNGSSSSFNKEPRTIKSKFTLST